MVGQRGLVPAVLSWLLVADSSWYKDRPGGRFPTPPPANGNRVLPTNPFDDSSSEDEEVYSISLADGYPLTQKSR